MKEHEYYNLHAAANAGKADLERRIEALEKAIEVLVNRFPPTDYAVAKKYLNELGITVRRK